MDQFRLFPPQASTTSHEVDALFFALTLISLFFMAVIFLPIIFFSVKYRRGSPADRSNPRSGSFLIERLDDRTNLPFAWTLCLGGCCLFSNRAKARECDRRAGRWQTMDVETSTRRRQTRDQ